MLLLLFWATQPVLPQGDTPSTVRLTVAGLLALELEVQAHATVSLTISPRAAVVPTVAEE